MSGRLCPDERFHPTGARAPRDRHGDAWIMPAAGASLCLCHEWNRQPARAPRDRKGDGGAAGRRRRRRVLCHGAVTERPSVSWLELSVSGSPLSHFGRRCHGWFSVAGACVVWSSWDFSVLAARQVLARTARWPSSGTAVLMAGAPGEMARFRPEQECCPQNTVGCAPERERGLGLLAYGRLVARWSAVRHPETRTGADVSAGDLDRARR